jgi:hypothetical protein
MKKQFMLRLTLLAVLGACGSLYAGAFDLVEIDENGIGTWVDSFSETHHFSGTFTDDPSGGKLSALVYMTPFTFTVQGDYEIYTPNTPELVGIVRFFGNNTMIFYDNDVGDYPSLADGSGMPVNRMSYLQELDQAFVGDPISRAIVTPREGMAGFSGINRQYTFLSIYPVPEPGAFALLACSAALLALRRRRPLM